MSDISYMTVRIHELERELVKITSEREALIKAMSDARNKFDEITALCASITAEREHYKELSDEYKQACKVHMTENERLRSLLWEVEQTWILGISGNLVKRIHAELGEMK
jgi:chromosome segregation ATPase